MLESQCVWQSNSRSNTNVSRKAKKLKALEREYLESVQALETSYLSWIETTKADIAESTTKLQTLKTEHAEAKTRIDENIVMNSVKSAAVVLPSTIADDFMNKCISEQPVLAGLTPLQHGAFVDMLRKICDQAVIKQKEAATAMHVHPKAPPPLIPGKSAGSGLTDAQRNRKGQEQATTRTEISSWKTERNHRQRQK